MPFLLRLLGFNRKDFTNSHHRTNPSYRKQGLSLGLAARLAAPRTRHSLRATLETCSKLREHEATLPPEPRAATSHRCAGGGGLRASRPRPPPPSTSQAHHVYLWKTRQQLHRGSSGARGWEAVPAGHWGGPAHDTENLLMGEEEEGSCWMHTPPQAMPRDSLTRRQGCLTQMPTGFWVGSAGFYCVAQRSVRRGDGGVGEMPTCRNAVLLPRGNQRQPRVAPHHACNLTLDKEV